MDHKPLGGSFRPQVPMAREPSLAGAIEMLRHGCLVEMYGGFRVEGLGFGFWVWGSGFRV